MLPQKRAAHDEEDETDLEGEGGDVYVCDMCGLHVNSQHNLNEHMKWSHNQIQTKNGKVDPSERKDLDEKQQKQQQAKKAKEAKGAGQLRRNTGWSIEGWLLRAPPSGRAESTLGSGQARAEVGQTSSTASTGEQVDAQVTTSDAPMDNTGSSTSSTNDSGGHQPLATNGSGDPEGAEEGAREAVNTGGGGNAGVPPEFACAHYLPKEVRDAAGNEGFLGCVPMKTIPANASFLLSASGFVSPTCRRFVATAGGVCTECAALQWNSGLKKVVELCTRSPPPTQHFNKLSTDAVIDKLRESKKKNEALRLEALNRNRKLINTSKALDLYKKLVVYVTEHDVPRLRQTLSVALRQGRGIGGLLEVLARAAEGAYRAMGYNEVEEHMAWLFLSLGGKQLLYAANRLGLCPSRRYLSRLEQVPRIFACPDDLTINILRHNLDSFETLRGGRKKTSVAYFIQVDEVKNNQYISYENKLDAVMGLVGRADTNFSRQFDTFEEAERLQNLIRVGDLVPCTDLLVFAVIGNGVDDHHATVLAILPFHKSMYNPQRQKNQIETLCRAWNAHPYTSKLGPIVKVGADGEPRTRQAVRSIMKSNLQDVNPNAFELLKACQLLDLQVGPEGMTFGPDPKHVLKRVWRALVGGKGLVVVENCFNCHIFERVLEILGIDHAAIERILRTDDKQSVPKALEAILTVQKFVDLETRNFKNQDHDRNIVPFLPDLKILGRLSILLQQVYFNMKLSLGEQLEMQAEMAHILFVLQLEHGSAFISGMLYHDLISMVQDNFITVARLQVMEQMTNEGLNHKYFICTQGSDALEQIFSILRTLSHNRGFDTKGFAEGVSTAHRLREIYEEHPDWHLEKRRLSPGTQSMDRDTRPRNWKGNVEVFRVNLQKSWKMGASNAVKFFKTIMHYQKVDLDWFQKRHEAGATLLQPKAGAEGMVGVTDLNTVDEEEDEAGGKAGLEAGEQPLDIILSNEDEGGAEEDGGGSNTIPSRNTATQPLTTDRIEDYVDGFNDLGDGHAFGDTKGGTTFVHDEKRRYIMVDGKPVDKATVLRCMDVHGEGLSPARLMRVRGLTPSGKLANSGKSLNVATADATDKILSVGDPIGILVHVQMRDGKETICLAVCIVHPCIEQHGSHGCKKVGGLSTDLLSKGGVTVNYRVLDLVTSAAGGHEEDPNWIGSPMKKLFEGKVDGSFVTPLNPELVVLEDITNPESAEKYGFRLSTSELQAVVDHRWQADQHRIQTMHTLKFLGGAGEKDVLPYRDRSEAWSFVVEGHHPERPKYQMDTVRCDACDKMIYLEFFRAHIGMHILEGDIDAETMPCGMCGLSGRDGCTLNVDVNTKQSRRSGAEPVMYVRMNGVCKGYTPAMRGDVGRLGKIHWKACHKASTKQPCTNVPVVCTACSSRAGQQVWVWKYNLEAHFESKHDGISIPPEALIDDKERQQVKQLKNKHQAT